MTLIDHACLDLLINWEQQHKNTGGSLVLDWESLRAKFGQRMAKAEPLEGPLDLEASWNPTGDGSKLIKQQRRFFREGWRPLGKESQDTVKTSK